MQVSAYMAAIQTQNILIKKKNELEKNLQKASSGQKIVNAGDGASEYAISEKMRKMIRDLEQTKMNVRNGTSVTQTALGGLDNITDIMKNIKALTINSCNDTNSSADREIIQKEIDQRLKEIDNIAYGTEILGNHPLCMEKGMRVPGAGYATALSEIRLSGNGGYNIYAEGSPVHYIGAMSYFGVRMRVHDAANPASPLELNINYSAGFTKTVDNAAKRVTYSYNDAAKGIAFDVVQSYRQVVKQEGDRGGTYYDLQYEVVNRGGGDLEFDIMLPMDPLSGNMLEDPSVNGVGQLSNNVRYDSSDLASGQYGEMICNPQTFPGVQADVTAILTGEDIINQPDVVVYGGKNSVSQTDTNTYNANWDVITGTGPFPANYPVNYHSTSAWLDKSISAGSSYKVNTLFGLSYPLEYTGSLENQDLWIQSGTKSNDGFFLPLCNATTKGLGIQGLDVRVDPSQYLSSKDTVGIIDAALEKITSYSTRFGAYQQRMENIEDARTIQVENITSAESVIRDANMAKQVVDVTKTNLLMQPAQAMLSQANSRQKDVLSLLQ